jgi:hypothetical protein
MYPADSAIVRAEAISFGRFRAFFGYLEDDPAGGGPGNLKKTLGGGPCSRSIKPGTKVQQEFGFTIKGELFAGEGLEIDFPHTVKQPKNPSRKPVSICHPVTAQPFLKIACLSHINNFVLGVPHQIDPGSIGQAVKETRSQLIHQWLGMGEEEKLTHHARLSTLLP